MNHANEMSEKDFQELIKDVQAVSSYTGASMKEAYETYLRCNKDVVKAIIELEEAELELPIYETVVVQGERLFDYISEMIVKGNVSRVIIKRNDCTLLTIPVTMGAIGVIMFPYVSVITLLALMFGQFDVIVERDKHAVKCKEEQQGVKKMRLATVDRV
ncbi:DUF4342 domain-containing protein [Desulfuribacillus alkaliarsenatis]|uniref:DUF4342 domain-containing protein n=1 Tax=Desulfuribacillus alkaliarsenatis TaxID=766136 RepID=A0A1E5G057_9FIRM|nr:DUF4342 domain-containing protein [Desulfuribacillus alkaliarsenatis]OEF96217.1 hypothetical protein BHF68_08610 [Desulfuribacillus alkaliarsenatis]